VKAPTAPPPPQITGFSYVRDLGHGGFSDVYLYEQAMPRRQVAIKVLRVDTFDERQRHAFTAEADAMAQLGDHDNIVSVLAADLTSDGRPYLVLAYYPNGDLASRVADQTLTLAEALRVGIQLASAVQSAHNLGLIHRDIKPANVLVGRTGAPGLADFGIASQLDARQDDEEVGVSIPWTAPEVLSGQSNGSTASDIYSLGATIWHLLVGRSPFRVPGGDNSQSAMVNRILRSPVPPTGLGSVPPGLERLLAQCMAKQPALRPQSALQLARDLQQIESRADLSRTEIVVLDGPETARQSRGTTEPSANEEATIGKPPISLPSGLPLIAGHSAVTEGRGPIVRPTQGEDSAATIHKPTSVGTATELDGSAPDVASQQRWIAIAAAVVVVLVAAGIGLKLIDGGQSDDETNSGGDITGTVVQPPPDNLTGEVPVAPVLSACRVAGGKALVTWDPVPGAASYQYDDADGAIELQPPTDETEINVKLPQSGRLRLEVQALNSSGVAGEMSQPAVCEAS
jgi:serine/threonine protein kinase